MRQHLIVGLACLALLFGCLVEQPAAQQAQPQGQQPQNPPAPSPPAAQVKLPQPPSEYMASYEITADSDPTTLLKASQYAKDGKFRQDIINTAKEVQEYRFYFLPQGSYACSSYTEGWKCKKTTTAVKKNVDLIRLYIYLFENSPPPNVISNVTFTIKADKTRQLLGTTANCFKADGNNGDVGISCFSPEGVILYIKGTSKDMVGDTELKATSYSLSVPDSDFELPAASQEG